MVQWYLHVISGEGVEDTECKMIADDDRSNYK